MEAGEGDRAEKQSKADSREKARAVRSGASGRSRFWKAVTSQAPGFSCPAGFCTGTFSGVEAAWQSQHLPPHSYGGEPLSSVAETRPSLPKEHEWLFKSFFLREVDK